MKEKIKRYSILLIEIKNLERANKLIVEDIIKIN